MAFFAKKQKFLSLKEAAKISGYAPDYIGSLIRKGKIGGKKTYSGVAWFTTEEAINNYQKKIKNEKLKAKFKKSIKVIYDIFPPEKIKKVAKDISGLKSYKNKRGRVFAFSWRFVLLILIILFLNGIGPVELFQKLAGFISGKEKTVDIYSSLCGGEWQNPQNAQGQPEVFSSGELNYFSEENSAVYKTGSLNLICQDFKNPSGQETEESQDTIPSENTTPPVEEPIPPVENPPETIPPIENVTPPTSFFNKLRNFFGFQITKAQQSLTFEELQRLKFQSAKIKLSFAIGEKKNDLNIQENIAPEIPNNEVPENPNIEFPSNPLEFLKGPTPPAEEPTPPAEEPVPPAENPPETTPPVENTTPPAEELPPSENTTPPVEEPIPPVENPPETIPPIENVTPPTSFFNKLRNFFGNLVNKKTLIVKAQDILQEVPPAEDTNQSVQEGIIVPDLDTKIIIWYSLDDKNWEILDTISSSNLSNYIKGGYFTYDAKFIRDWYDLKDLKIRLEGVVGGETNVTAYLDSVWVEVKYQNESEALKEKKKILKVKVEENSLVIPDAKEDFSVFEDPNFVITEPDTKIDELINSKKVNVIEEIIRIETVDSKEQSFLEKGNNKNFLLGKILGFVLGKIFPARVQAQTNNLKLQILDPHNQELTISPQVVSYLENGQEKFKIKIPKPDREFQPGVYKLEIEFEKNDVIYDIEQEFSWGVLAINTNKSIYLPNERAYIQMGVLDNMGQTICDASLILEITTPSSQKTILSTENGYINNSGAQCGPHSVTYKPDYFTYYDLPEETGVYQLHLIADSDRQKGLRDIYDSFEVRDSAPFEVERIGPTRIYPPEAYDMKIKVKANEDFQGEVREIVPNSFEVSGDNLRTQENGEEKLIFWDVNWKSGESYDISYNFKAPYISPYLYLLGPLKIGSFEEIRKWQIAADAPTTWVQTTQADFNAGVLSQVDTTVSSGDVKLATHACWGTPTACDASCLYATQTGATYYTGDSGCSASQNNCPGNTYYDFSGSCNGAGSGTCYKIGGSVGVYTTCNTHHDDPSCAGNCSGSTSVCANYPTDPPCSTCSCSWSYSAAYCSGSCSCSGKAQGACGTCGCTWTPSCGGSWAACSTHGNEGTCIACDGCSWTGTRCTGTGTCSGTGTCAACGCTVGGSCSGSCSCSSYGSGTCGTCGCTWNAGYYYCTGSSHPCSYFGVSACGSCDSCSWAYSQWHWNATGSTTKYNAGTACTWYSALYYSSGTIASQVLDTTKAGTAWNQLSWNASKPANTNITFEVRASDTSFLKSDVSPSWTAVGGTSPVTVGLPTGRYMQWRATLSTTDYTVTPTLNDVTISYTTVINISGTAKQYDESTNATNSETVKVAINASAKTQTGSTSSGAWTIAIPSDVIGSGDVVTVWINGVADANEAVGVTKYDGSGDISGINLSERHLSIGSDDNQIITNANLSQYDNSVSSNEDIFIEVDANNDLTIPATSTQTTTDQILIIKASNIYRPDSTSSGNVTTPNLKIASSGTLTADGNTIKLTAAGTPFTQSGTFNYDTSTFQYAASADTTITAATYYNLSLTDPPPEQVVKEQKGRIEKQKEQTLFGEINQYLNDQTIFSETGRYLKESLSGLSGSAEDLVNYFKTSNTGEAQSPLITNASVEPKDVQPGQTMTVRAEIEDESGIKEVKADMGGIETINLKLKEGTSKRGIWQAEWLVHDTATREYITTITATNTLGNSSQKEVKWTDAWLTGWSYRKSHLITASSGAGTNYQVGIKAYYGSGTDGTETVTGITMGKVYLNSHSRTDFGDVRFTDSGGSTQLDYWVESKTDSNNAVIWVEVSADLSSVNQTIYIYYGKSDATYPYGADQTQMNNTFIFADHFYGSSVDGTKWSTLGSPGISVSGSVATIAGNASAWAGLLGKTGMTYGRYRCYGQMTSVSYYAMLGLGDQIDPNNGNQSEWYWNLGSYLVYWGTSGSHSGGAASNGTTSMATYEQRWKSGNIYGYINGSASFTLSTYIPSATMYAEGTDYTANSVTKMDWVFLAKWISTEPAHSTWGTEEPSTSAPTVTISAATSITSSTATINGNVTATGGENPTVTMYWGKTDGGQTIGSWTFSSAPTSPAQPQGVAAFYTNITSLDPGTLYYFSAKATNSLGTSWPVASLSFTTSANAPTVTISAATSVTISTATINGNVTATGGVNPTVTMYWGKTDGGQTIGSWTFSSAPTSPAQPQGVAAFYTNITSLDPSTLYYFSAKATNSGGTGWPAASLSFTTSAPTYTLATGTFTIQNDLLIGDGTHALNVTADTNDPTLDVNNNFTIQASATFVASNSGTFTVAGNWAKTGTFTHSSGTVTFDNAAKTSTFSGSSTFYGFTCNTASKNLTFTAATTQTIAAGGALTLNGQACGTKILLRSTAASQWNINVPAPATVSYVDVQYSNATGSAITDNYYTNSGNTTNWTWGTTCGMTVSGNAYNDEATTVWTGCDNATANISLVVNGGTASTTHCHSADGSYSFSDVTVAANNPVSVFFNATDKGVAATVAADSSSNITLNPRKNIVWVKTEGAVANITNTNLDHCDSVSPAACANVPYSVTTGALTVADGAELHIESSKTFAPGGTVTTSVSSTPADRDGDIHIAGIFSVGTNDVSVGGDWNNAGTFSKSTGQTTTFTATGATFTITDGGSNFDTLVFNGTNGRWSFADSTTIDVDLTMTAGTLAGTNDITVNGGDVTGNGAINLTGGAFLLDTAGNFGGNTDWNFYDLTFGNGAGVTKTTKTGTGAINVSHVLTIAASQELDAGDDTWTLSGTGTPFVITGTFTYNTSTIAYTGATTATNVTAATYYNLNLGGAATTTTYTAAGDITVTNVLTIVSSSGTNTFDASSRTITLSGSGTPFVNNETFTASTSTVKYTGNDSTNITAATYNKLELLPSADLKTFTLASGTINTNDYLTIGNGTNTGTINATTNDPTLNVDGNFTISASATFIASDSGTFSVGGNWSNAATATFTHSSGTITFDAITTGKTISDGGDPFYNILFNGSGGGWTYQDGCSTAPNQTTVQNGTPLFLNTKTGTVSVTGGELDVDWYLGVHVADAANTSTHIDTGDADITISENSGSPASTVWRYNGGWGSGAVSQTTGTDSNGDNPQPTSTGAIRIREYSKTSGATTYYLYNLQIAWQSTYGQYNYYSDYGSNYLTSTANSGANKDAVIGVNWYRATVGTMNAAGTINEPPTTGSWYCGMMKGLEVTITGTSINFGNLDTSNNFTATAGTQTNITVTTSAASGYIVTAWETQLMTCSDAGACATDTIPNFTYGTYADPQAWIGLYCKDNSNYCGFGFTSSDTDVGGSNRYNGATEYTFFPADSSAPVRVMDYSGPVASQSYLITYRISTSLIQRPGPYGTTIVYVITAQY